MRWWLGLVTVVACAPVDGDLPPDAWSAAGERTGPPAPYVEEVEGHPDRWYSDLLFADAALPHVHIDLSGPAYASLVANPYTWVEGRFDYDGVTYAPVGIRCKGENSFLPIDQKCSLKVDFNRYADLPFMGLEGLTLNNMSNDTSMMHERVSYRLFRDAGVPAVRASHTTVTLNDQGPSLYAILEDVDENMIAHWLDPSGTMFEIWDVDFYASYVLDDNPDNGDFQFEFGTPEDRQQILDLAYALETPGAAGLLAAEEFIDVDQFALYWAAASVVGQFDSYPYSSPGDDAHIYLNPADGRFVFLPHGMDETFYDPWRDVEGVNGIMATRCKAVAECHAQYRATAWNVYDVTVDTDLGGYARFVKDQIRSLVAADTAKNVVYSTEAVYSEQDDMIAFIDGRARDLERDLGPR